MGCGVGVVRTGGTEGREDKNGFFSLFKKNNLMSLIRGLVLDATNGTTFGNTTLAVGKIWVTGKEARGVGSRKGAPWGVHPRIQVRDLPPGVRPITHSPRD